MWCFENEWMYQIQFQNDDFKVMAGNREFHGMKLGI